MKAYQSWAALPFDEAACDLMNVLEVTSANTSLLHEITYFDIVRTHVAAMHLRLQDDTNNSQNPSSRRSQGSRLLVVAYHHLSLLTTRRQRCRPQTRTALTNVNTNCIFDLRQANFALSPVQMGE